MEQEIICTIDTSTGRTTLLASVAVVAAMREAEAALS